MTKIKDYYRSSELSLICTISLFYPIIGIDKTNPSKVEFLFERQEGLDRIIEAFWKNELQVSPLAYFQQLKVIKSRLYGEK